MKSYVQSWKPEKPMRMRKITIRRTIAIFKNCLISILLVMDILARKKEYTASKIVITKAMGTSDVMD